MYIQTWGYVVDCSAIKRCIVVLWHCGKGIYTSTKYEIHPRPSHTKTVITWNRNGLGAFCSMVHVFCVRNTVLRPPSYHLYRYILHLLLGVMNHTMELGIFMAP